MNDRLELLIKPAIKSMGEATADRNNGLYRPRGLVDFCCHVEVGKLVGHFKGAINIGLVGVGDLKGVNKEKGLNESLSLNHLGFSGVCRELFVGCGVRQVLEDMKDVFGFLNDARPKILVRWEDLEVFEGEEVLKDASLIGHQVGWNLATAKLFLKQLQEV